MDIISIIFFTLLICLFLGLLGAGIYSFIYIQKKVKSECMNSAFVSDTKKSIKDLETMTGEMSFDIENKFKYYVNDPKNVMSIEDTGYIKVDNKTEHNQFTLGNTRLIDDKPSNQFSILNKNNDTGIIIDNSTVNILNSGLGLGSFTIRDLSDGLNICKAGACQNGIRDAECFIINPNRETTSFIRKTIPCSNIHSSM
jgi:hypothetical protein